MTKPQRPPMFGPTAWIDLEVWKPGPGKCRLTSDIVASLMKANAETFCGNCTTKLPMNSANGDTK
jgi:hypothetical protein